MSVDAETIINHLATRIAKLEVDLAVALAQIPARAPELEPEPEGDGEEVVRVFEVIDGGKDDGDEPDRRA